MANDRSLLPHALGLRARLLILVTLAALPMLAAVIYAGVLERRHAESHAEEEALRLAHRAAEEHQHLLIEARHLLTLMARQPEIHTSDRATCSQFLARFLLPDAPFANFGVVDSAGRLICSADPDARALNQDEQQQFRNWAEEGRFVVGGYLSAAVGAQPALVFASPVTDAIHQPNGAVFAALSLRWLGNIIARAQLPNHSLTMLIGRDLRVLARFPGDEQQLGQSIATTPLGAALTDLGDGGIIHATDPGGAARLYGVKPLFGDHDVPEAYVAVGIATHIAHAEIDAVMRRNVGAVLLLSALLLATAWWGSGTFVMRHLRRLMAVTSELERGNLRARAPELPGGNEFARLCRAYNSMADALEHRDGEIRRHLLEIARLNRVYAVLSASNAAALRIHDRQPLLEEICRIAVTHGGFRIAWVAELQPETRQIQPVAWAGTDRNAVVALAADASTPGGAAKPSPTLIALTQNRQSLLTEPELAATPSAGSLSSLGIRAVVALPLIVRGHAAMCVNLCAADRGDFDQEELRLLQTMAADAAFCLDYLEKERLRQYLAYYDPLTDLPNRILFLNRLDQEMQRARAASHQVAVLVLGLRGLRRINDSLGRHLGDEVLIETAQHLRRSALQGNTLARLGNDEFGLILTDSHDPARIGDTANHVLANAPKSLRIDERDIYIDWNGGVALYPDDAVDADALVKNAELAAHAAAKNVGSALLFYSPSMDKQVRKRYEIELGLREAAQRGELKLHYQPVVDIHSGRALSVEALMRWNSNSLGPLPATTFIPIAEETGLIVPLGEWAVAHACRQSQAWQAAGHPPIPIALNVSVKQLQQTDFVERLIGIIEAAGCKVGTIPFAIEVTESELMRSVKSTADILRRLKDHGMSICVDDFGTGYSSLSYLQQLPIDVLKVDRSFVQDLSSNPRTLAMVKAVIAMAHSLGLRVVAEGVENNAELAILKEIGCDAIQGYLVSMPCAANEVEPLFHRTLIGDTSA